MTHPPQANERDSAFQQESWRDEPPPGSWNDLLELMCDHGFAGMAQAMQVLLNEAMKLERSAVLGARPHERTPLRRGQANGFKPKTVETRLGALELRVPQTRGVPFYPSALEKGQRSERALKLDAMVIAKRAIERRLAASDNPAEPILARRLRAQRQSPLVGQAGLSQTDVA